MTHEDPARRPGIGISRRAFTRLLALTAPTAVAAREVLAQGPPALPPTPARPTEAFWQSVRQQFTMPAGLAVLNAANLCPASRPAADALARVTRAIDDDPSFENRRQFGEGREAARKTIAAHLRVPPEDVLITRNTSEGNNFVSSGVELKTGDEVVVLAENHPSVNAALREKAKRFGFTVTPVAPILPHPGPDAYVEAFAKAITPRTRLVAITHVTASAGDVLPVREICRLARERGALSLVDGAQSFGVLDIDLADMQPDFFTGSAHKWPCGPREVGVLYVNPRAKDRLWPSVVSLYAGAVGVSKTHGALGQRDEASIIGFGEALAFLQKIGAKVVEARSLALASRLADRLAAIPGVTVWTSSDPARRAAIVTVQPGTADPARLAAALYEKARVACTARGGADRPGLRFSPHFYNLEAEIDRAADAVRALVARGTSV